MAALLQAEAPIGAGAFSSPLFLFSGAIHVIRMLQHLHGAASSSATETAPHIDEPALGSPRQRQPPQRPPSRQDGGGPIATLTQPSRDAVADRSQPPPTQPPVPLLPSSHPRRPPTPPLLPRAREGSSGAPWQLQPGEPKWYSAPRDRDKAPPAEDARPARTSPPAATAADAAAASSGALSCPHRHPPPLDRSWEAVAALYASATAGEALRLAASASSSSSPSTASASSSSSASLTSHSEPPEESSGSPPSLLWRPPSGPLYLHPGTLPPHPPSTAQLLPPPPPPPQQQQLPAAHQRTNRHRHRRLPAAYRCPHRSRYQLVRQQRYGLAVATPPQLLGGSGLGGGDDDGYSAAARRGAALEPGMLPPPPPPPLPMAVLVSRRRGAPREERRVEDERAEALAARKGAGEGTGGPPQWLQVATTLAGAVSRTAAQVAIHPLDTLKTRMQVRLQTPQLQVWRAVMACAATRPRALAAWAGAAGVRDMLLGLSAAVAGVLSSSMLYFAAEPRIRERLAQALSADGESPACRLTASAAAATLSALIRVPADVVKHRVQAYAYPTITAAVKSILATHGPAGFYAGFGATLLRDAPEIVIQFTVYRRLKALLEQWRRSQSRGFAAAAAPAAATDGCSGRDGGAGGGGSGAAENLFLGGAAGAAAGAAAALATTPLDVIKTQMQCGAATSVPAAAAQVLRAGGPTALFGGLAPRLMQTTLCSALFFMCFEASKACLNDLAAAASVTAAAAAATPAAVTAAVVAASAAAALKPPPQGWPLPLQPPQHQHQQRFGRRLGRRQGNSAAAATAAAPTRMEVWGPSSWTSGGVLAPVALYAYAYAGATAPAAAVTMAATTAGHTLLL